jgi:hypothetical protein
MLILTDFMISFPLKQERKEAAGYSTCTVALPRSPVRKGHFFRSGIRN